MNLQKLYRRRLIPFECFPLDDDEIIQADDKVVITKWEVFRPKKDFSHGCSCYYLDLGIKVSKFYREDNSLLYWYCDIVDYEYKEEDGSLTVTDLLADVLVFPDGTFRVVDLDELAEALEKNLLTMEQMCVCLHRLQYLLSLIYRDKFDKLQAPLKDL